MGRIEQLTELLNDNPHDSFLQHAMALEYIKLGNDKAARQLFETLLHREPGYTGSYFHLAKLLERMGEREAAISCYLKGMDETKKAGDHHAWSELKSAYEELIY